MAVSDIMSKIYSGQVQKEKLIGPCWLSRVFRVEGEMGCSSYREGYLKMEELKKILEGSDTSEETREILGGYIRERERTEEVLSKKIEELRETTRQLERSQEMLQIIIESIPVRVFWKDLTLRYLGCNTLFARDAGLRQPDQLIGLDDFSMGWKEQAQLYQDDDRKVMESGLPKKNIVEPQTTPAGTKIWLNTSKVPLRMPDGEVFGVLGIYEDITECKQMEEELRHERDRAQSYLDTVETVIVALNVKGEITTINRKGCQLFGCAEGELLGKLWFSECLSQPYGMEVVYPVFKKLIAGEIGTSEYFENLVVTRSGESRQIAWHNALLRGEDGQIIGTLSAGEDITERRSTEKALLEAERLSAIGELSAGVAHDFNNSLQVIFGSVELAMLVPNIPKEVMEHLQSIKKCAGDTASRVRQLQRFTRKNTLAERYTIDLNKLLDEAVLQSKPLWKDEAERKGLSISFQQNYGSSPFIDGDAGELGSVFFNLLKNSFESMTDGGNIILETENDSKNKVVLVRIKDTGKGMDEETAKKIFQPFFTTKGFEPGRGLGMSGAFSIIRDHGGKIFVKESSVGQGTTIEISFPVGTIQSVPEKLVDDYLGSIRVLWVDDEESIRELGKKQLEALGHQADIAESGEEALKLLERNSYDLLISDIGMPRMSGWQLAAAVKSKYAGLKVALVSGWGSDISDEEKEKYGVGYVLGKPTPLEKIKHLAGEVLQSKK